MSELPNSRLAFPRRRRRRRRRHHRIEFSTDDLLPILFALSPSLMRTHKRDSLE
jgi:hypothetical protein